MTTLREAAQQALEALEQDNPGGRSATITALRAALAQPDRAQRMRDAGYTRRPTLREMAEDEQEQEAIAQNLQSRLDAAFLLEERRQEIAQPRREGEQEPVAWRTFDGEGGWDYCAYADNEHYRDNYIKRNGEKYASWVEPLYSAPPRREWRSLSEEEIALIDWENLKTRKDAVRAIEAALKEKNND